jgi:TatD DNase family protein
VIDTHAHLDALDDAPQALARAREAGVGRVITIGTTLDSCRAALELAEREEGVFVSLGLHPHEAGAATASEVDELATLLDHPKAVAVGETGLDHFRDYAPHDRQLDLFRAQAGLAAAAGKPLVVHTRSADDETVAVLTDLSEDTKVARVPADRILAETDSPYLSPQPVRGRPNEPANVVHTLATLAEARGEDPADLERAIDANATVAFSLP